MTFRFAARRVFLTYSNLSDAIHKEAIYHTIEERFPIKTFYIVEEHHVSGTRHIHAVLEFRRKVDSKDQLLFDINDGEIQHHPNIQKIKKGQAHWERLIEYCEKEDNSPLANTSLKPSWGDMIENSQSSDDFLRLVRRHYPRDFALNHSRLVAMTKIVYPTYGANTIAEYSPDFSITMPPELTLFRPLQGHTTVVVGRPGCGKTTWAKTYAPKPSLFIRHLDSLSELLPLHQSIIFDDLDFRHLPVATQKFLVDTKDLAEIHIRYRVARIPINITRIFTANEFPFLQEGIHGLAIARRIEAIFIQ